MNQSTQQDGRIIKEPIFGVDTKILKRIPDERGWLMEMLRADDEMFMQFGQVYLTAVFPGVVKAWHYHKIQTDHFVCVQGMAKVVLYDSRPDSPTHGAVNEFFIGEINPVLVQIPPLVYHGFKGISPETAVILNVPTEVYRYEAPDEYRIEPHGGSIPYDWSRKDG
jgi:dTDP-4-dehydrorhamnose 3,5-epimerase